MTNTALLVIDVQMAFVHRDAAGAVRSCPEASQNIGMLLSAARANGLPVIHVHHHSLEENSAFRAELSGSDVQPFAAPQNDEAVYVKHVNSSFIGTSLETDLRDAGIERLILCGGTANHCVETTTRMAGNLGFDAVYVSDAVWAYNADGIDGSVIPADTVHAVSMANLHGEFATVMNTETVLEQL
ncbi:isochorismatase [Amylibacter ulvae]|uniref:Isochorismatase n=1 Tax=Paramylibacter ulvae TaxID=1651968 RepID=A0ABQ3D0L2_9RHOB|nr:cysteine hydrolase family protein [Amylibacter ulvae]GHA52609.1 isochorismatase [Amylibacter ulvae]